MTVLVVVPINGYNDSSVIVGLLYLITILLGCINVRLSN